MESDALSLRLIAAAAAIAPATVLLAYFNVARPWRDLRELTWIAFGLGFTVAIPVSDLVSLYTSDMATIVGTRLYAAVVAFLEASLPEELGKFFIVYFFILRHEDLRRPLDVVPLAVMVSLGFATIENVYYVFGSEDWGGTAMIRAVTAIPMHSTMGVVMGYYGALSIAPGRPPWRALVAMLLWPVVLHGFYDYPVFAVQRLYDRASPVSDSELLEFQIVFLLAIVAAVFMATHAIKTLSGSTAFMQALPIGEALPDDTPASADRWGHRRATALPPADTES